MASTPASSEHVPPGFLGLQEAADRLGVHYMTAYRYVRTGRLPATRIGSQWWVDPGDLGMAGAGTGVAGRTRTATRKASQEAAVRRLEDRLVAGDEPGAWTIVESRLGSGSDPDEILMDELGQAMRSVGAGWEAGDLHGGRRASGLGGGVAARGPPRRPVHDAGAQARQCGARHPAERVARPDHRHGGQRPARRRLRGRRPRSGCPGRRVRERRLQDAACAGGGCRRHAPGTTTAPCGRSCAPCTRSARACRCSSAAPASPTGSTQPGSVRLWSGRDARSLGEVIEDLDRAAR